MRKVAVLLGSWAHRRSTITWRDLGPGYDVTVITAKHCTYLNETDLQLPMQRLTAIRDIVRHVPKLRTRFGWGSDQYLFGLEKALADTDIVLSSSPTCLFSYQAAQFCERAGKPLVLQEIENIPFRDFKRRIYPCRLRALSVAKFVAAATRRAKMCLLLEGVAPEKLRVVPFGIDTELFHPHAKQFGMREQLGFREDQVVILFVGRVSWEKGVFDFIHAAKLLADDPESRKHDPRFLIVGGGPELPAAIDRVNQLNLSERVQTLSNIPFDRMPALYGSADIVVAPSIPARESLEQWCLVASEAMATGVPVVSTYCGGIPEVLGDSGVLVQPADPISLLDGIRRLVCNPGMRATLGESGRARTTERYDWRVVGSLYAQLLDEALGR